jgi:hypothetical protein
VVLATRSEHPVIDAEWVEAGTHINTVGPKTLSAHEAPTELVAAATVVVSDSPAQAHAYGEPFFTDRDLIHLGAVLSGDPPRAGRATQTSPSTAPPAWRDPRYSSRRRCLTDPNRPSPAIYETLVHKSPRTRSGGRAGRGAQRGNGIVVGGKTGPHRSAARRSVS